MSDYAVKIPGQPRKKNRFIVYTRSNILYMSLPSCLGYPRGSKVSIGLDDTKKNRNHAILIADMMTSDLMHGKLVEDFNYYFPYNKNAKSVDSLDAKVSVTVKQAWDTYMKDITPYRKPTTIKYLKYTIYPTLSNVLTFRLANIEGIYEQVKKDTTPGLVVRVINIIILIIKNYYSYLMTHQDRYQRILREAKRNNKVSAKSNTALAIPHDEMMYIIETISNDYQVYGQFIKFIFLTGCRPSEAVGLTWDCISKHTITLGNSITRYEGSWELISGSKNGTIRDFPMTQELSELVEKIEQRENPWNLVFLTPRGKPIDLSNFSKDVWKKVTTTYTLYNIRDTFITRQVENKTPLAIIGKWCDNSESVIQKHYLAKTNTYVPI